MLKQMNVGLNLSTQKLRKMIRKYSSGGEPSGIFDINAIMPIRSYPTFYGWLISTPYDSRVSACVVDTDRVICVLSDDKWKICTIRRHTILGGYLGYNSIQKGRCIAAIIPNQTGFGITEPGNIHSVDAAVTATHDPYQQSQQTTLRVTGMPAAYSDPSMWELVDGGVETIPTFSRNGWTIELTANGLDTTLLLVRGNPVKIPVYGSQLYTLVYRGNETIPYNQIPLEFEIDTYDLRDIPDGWNETPTAFISGNILIPKGEIPT